MAGLAPATVVADIAGMSAKPPPSSLAAAIMGPGDKRGDGVVDQAAAASA